MLWVCIPVWPKVLPASASSRRAASRAVARSVSRSGSPPSLRATSSRNSSDSDQCPTWAVMLVVSAPSGWQRRRSGLLVPKTASPRRRRLGLRTMVTIALVLTAGANCINAMAGVSGLLERALEPRPTPLYVPAATALPVMPSSAPPSPARCASDVPPRQFDCVRGTSTVETGGVRATRHEF